MTINHNIQGEEEEDMERKCSKQMPLCLNSSIVMEYIEMHAWRYRN